MAYSASIRMAQSTGRSRRYRKSSSAGLIKGMFVALYRLVGLSFLLTVSLGFIVLISIVLLYGYDRAVNSEFFALRQIEIIGNKQLTYSQLTELLNVNTGDNLLQLNMSDTHSLLNKNPWIEDASVKRVFPDRLVINIVEKQAYFWLQDQDKLCYADETGKVITPVSPQRYVSLPTLHLDGETEDYDLEAVVGFLESRDFPFSLNDISWIRIRQTGTVEMYVDSLGLTVTLDNSQLESGSAKLGRVWADLGKRKERESVNRIIITKSNAWVNYSPGKQ
ncbi:MAG: FtsQ-type POTRA domain-containing protein [Desulfonatronovibrio sp.]